MKKFAYIAVAALAMGTFAACDEYTLPNPPAQSNQPEALFKAEDLQVRDVLSGTLNLASAEPSAKLVVLDYSVQNLPLDRSVKFTMEISQTEDFATVAEVPTLAVETEESPAPPIDGQAAIEVAALMAAYNANFTREPSASQIYVRYKAFIANAAGTEAIRVGGPDTYYAAGPLNFTPAAPSHPVESAYYLIGSFNGFSADGAVAMVKSQEGNPYDEPDFYLAFQVTAEQAQAGFSWAIIPGSAFNAGNTTGAYVGKPNTAADPLIGSLMAAENVQEAAATVPAPGSYMLKVNMYDLTYSIALAYESLYVNAQGYWPQYDKMLRLFTNDYVNYGGVVRTSRNFRLTCQASDTGLFYGEAEGSTPETADGTTKGKLGSYTEIKTTPALSVPANGLYYCWANIKDLTWKATRLETISMVGSFNGWNEKDPATVMTPDRYMTKFTYSGVVFDEGGEFKFNCNKSWAISFGGAMDDIVENGGNLPSPGAGTYDVTLDFTTIPYSVTLVKK